MRSKKTNRTQGYGFVKFEDEEVAKIASQSMNGYMMFGKQIVAEHLKYFGFGLNISPKHPDPFKYKHGSEKLRFVNWQHKFTIEKNKVPTCTTMIG
jgi:nucleolar protein 15